VALLGYYPALWVKKYSCAPPSKIYRVWSANTHRRS